MSKNCQCPKFSGDKYGQDSRLLDLTTAKQRHGQLRIVAVDDDDDDLTCGIFAMQQGSLLIINHAGTLYLQ